MADEGGIFTTDARCTIEGKPFVAVTYTDSDGKVVAEGQLSPAGCLALGIRTIQSAIEAERDAGLVLFFKEAGFEDNAIGALLTGMREHRQQWGPGEAKPMFDLADFEKPEES